MLPTARRSNRPERRSRKPVANFSDVPDLAPWAHGWPTSSLSGHLEQRCREVYRESEEAQWTVEELPAASSSHDERELLECMFPELEPQLVQELYAEATSPDQAIDTLLTLATATPKSWAAIHSASSCALPPLARDMGLGNHEQFPSLLDSQGWQVVSGRKLVHDAVGTMWRDCAQRAVDSIDKTTAPAPAISAVRTREAKVTFIPTQQRLLRPDQNVEERIPLETEYEFRQRVGQRRAQERAQKHHATRLVGKRNLRSRRGRKELSACEPQIRTIRLAMGEAEIDEDEEEGEDQDSDREDEEGEDEEAMKAMAEKRGQNKEER